MKSADFAKSFAVVLTFVAGAAACGAKTPCAHPGGLVKGAPDDHCSGVDPQVVDPATCTTTGDPNAATDPETSPVFYNAEANDDDCKYKVHWMVDPVCEQNGVYFTVTLTTLADGKPATGAAPRIEAFLTPTHVATNASQKAVEQGAGVYRVGPAVFDAPGDWTVRFHFYEDCLDGDPASPHGHAAFYVAVP